MRRELALPLAWALGGVAVGVVSTVKLAPAADPYASQDTYYLITNSPHGLSLGAVFLIFTLVYLVAVRAFATWFRPALGWVHFSLTLIGSGLIVSPMISGSLGLLPQKFGNPVEALRVWTRLTALGDDLNLAGLLVFAVAVVDAFWRRLRPERRVARR